MRNLLRRADFLEQIIDNHSEKPSGNRHIRNVLKN